jgi:hypothetical protein
MERDVLVRFNNSKRRRGRRRCLYLIEKADESEAVETLIPNVLVSRLNGRNDELV